MAMFAFGFYIMDKVDHFLNDNYSRLEVKIGRAHV